MSNVLYQQVDRAPTQRLLYNGVELIPLKLPLAHKPTYKWHIPGGGIMTTGELIDLAKIRNVVIKITEYNKRPL